ncbi:MAG: outer membrane beta-barrel protein [Draconibacterium sp.]
MKLSVIPFILFVFLSISVKSQAEEPKPRKFSFGVNFSPDYSYRSLHSNNPDHDFAMNQLNDWEVPAFGFTTGLSVRYLANEKFELESGIQFSDKTYNFDVNKDDFLTPDNGLNQPDDPAIPERSVTQNHYYYLGVPIKLNYYFLQKRIRMYVSAGISADFFLDDKSKSFMKFSDGTEIHENFENDYDYNKISLTGLAGFGAETKLSQRVGIRVEPVFRYSFTPLVAAPMKGYLYSAGLNFVLFYQ